MATTSIEWSEQTWNPTVGCTKISAGCRSCYAEIMHHRLTAMGQAKYADPFTIVKPYPAHLDYPLTVKKPTTFFVNSMSDLFHADVPFDYIQQVFNVMNNSYQHTYQVLTKRADRLYQVADRLMWTPNIWMGVSVENVHVADRIRYLRETAGPAVKFLSAEPLIGPLLGVDLSGIDWLIVGGESGKNARPMKPEWVEDIQRTCKRLGIAYFFKQTGTALAREWNLKSTKGGDMAEWPERFQVRELPQRP